MTATVIWNFMASEISTATVNGFAGVVRHVHWECIASDDTHQGFIGRIYGEQALPNPAIGDPDFVTKTDSAPDRSTMLGWAKAAMGADQVEAIEKAAKDSLANAITPALEPFDPPA